MDEFEKLAELEQEQADLGHLLGLNAGDLQAARADVKPTRDAALAGVPGKRVELATLEGRVQELEAEGRRLEARRMQVTMELSKMGQRDALASSLARDFELTDEQRKSLKAALESGTPKEAREEAGRLRDANNKAQTQAKANAGAYRFQSEDAVAW